MNQRFTIDGSDALERQLATLCETIRQRVRSLIPPSHLDGLVLGGGYGRGEGGVLRTLDGDQPYNDLEFFVFVRGALAEQRYAAALHTLAHELTPAAGIEVEFKVMTLAKLRRAEPSMFYYDLLMGHRWLIGTDPLFAGCEHHRDASRIPLHEATRLLMNRCSGLLYAKERLARAEFTADDADFVARNIAKAGLALGDVVLAAQGSYHWSCRERERRFTTLCSRAGGLFGELPDDREHHPLTPALSPWEREQVALPRRGVDGCLASERQLERHEASEHAATQRQPEVHEVANGFTTERQLDLLPLPLGEGWGEGEASRSPLRPQSPQSSSSPPLQTSSAPSQLLAHHAAGVRFKLHPERSDESREVLLARHAEVAALAQQLWLWLEERRLNHRFDTPANYALSSAPKCPEQSPLKSVAVNLRTFGPRRVLNHFATRYPRERLLRALPLLLWGMTSPAEQSMVRTCLHCDSATLSDAVPAYTKLWQRFN